jgi:hypothetical protein
VSEGLTTPQAFSAAIGIGAFPLGLLLLKPAFGREKAPQTLF